jgi:type VI secretion system protein ImpG
VHESLYPYYERELVFIRQLGQEFARRYPAAAGRLMLGTDRINDPHVERLVEAFALLAGRIHHKLDDEFPELTDALLGVLYPHYLAPIPSMGVVQFEADAERAQLADGFTIPRHSRLKTRPVADVSCRYRTGYPVTLWPLKVADARFALPPFPAGFRPPPQTAAVLSLRLQCLGGLRFSDLSVDTLRFYLSGDAALVAALYDVLFLRASSVLVRSAEKGAEVGPVVLDPAECLGQVGFDREGALLPYPSHAFDGYRLLTEFFAFPAKFLFIDLKGLGRVARAGFGKAVEVLISFREGSELLAQGVGPDTFRLGCTPVVNLFEKTAEPIPLTHARHEYRVVPDVASPDGMEVYAIESVTGTDMALGKTQEYLPFYSFRHGTSRERDRAYYYGSRRPGSRLGDRGTDVYLTLVDLDFDPSRPTDTNLVVRTVCTNRDQPNLLRRAGERLAFELEAVAPLARIRTVRMPTPPLRPPPRRGAYWRLVSHLNLNHLSISDPENGLDALKEILRLYDFSDPDSTQASATVNDQMIEGILSVRSRPVVGQAASPDGGGTGFCRGTEVTLELDEAKYVGTGVFLFATILERFLGLYTTVNSFTQLVVRTRQAEGVLRAWPPRAGDHPLL